MVARGNWRDNVKISRVTDDDMKYEKTKYYSHTLAEFMYEENRNDWILITISRIDKQSDYQYWQFNNINRDNK